MKPTNTILVTLIVCLACVIGIDHWRCEAQTAIPIAPTVQEMAAIPNGNYLVTLELDGKEKLLNVEVKNGRARCVNSSDAGLKGMQGDIRRQRNGLFVVQLANEGNAMSQLWIFRKDGTAAIREVPDRGEVQKAVPVKGETLELPKKTP